MNPQERSWNLLEYFFHRHQQHYYETILTIGNGYLGSRATFEEGYPDEIASTLVHGIFNHHADDLVPDLANVPVWFAMQIDIEGERFRLDRGKVQGFQRRLSLKDAILQREALWQVPSGKVVRLAFERFASLDDPHILVQRCKITALNDLEALNCVAFFDATKALNIAYTAEGARAVSHWSGMRTGTTQGHQCWWEGRTNQSQYHVGLMQHVMVDRPALDLGAVETEAGIGNGVMNVVLKTGESLTLTRLVCIATSRDTDNVLAFINKRLGAAVEKGYDALKIAHCAAWEALWEEMDVQIEGDEYAQLALRFATYHLLIAAPYRDAHVSIGAKTLSGPGYKGHVFWDTELFMLPVFTLSHPQTARNLLMYRYHHLAGAREKAKEAGYKGAMFPWESTDTGRETTPRWTLPDQHGNRIRIWTGDNEQHISSDIAYAVWQYWQWTGDNEFLRDYGAEIILDTAVFWGSRVEWNASAGRYELSQQIGPDEFHENINNPVYTNRLVVWHLERALEMLDWLQKTSADKAKALAAHLQITDETLAHWQDIIAKMYIPYHRELDVYEQFDGFFERKFVEVALYSPRTTSMDMILGHKDSNASQVIKQADVVMLIALLGSMLGNREALIRNWKVYEARTAHDSSLSAAIYAWVGTQLGLNEEAYELWMHAAGIDLQNNKGNVRDGIHAAACGGLRQAVIFGFAGLRLDPGSATGWVTEPNLPRWWRSVAFTFYHHGKKQQIRLENKEAV
jgi:trehalose/maltose hydrolase-like predicted phosphorylase